MPYKESGSIYVSKCPICKDELIVGWIREEKDIFSFDKNAKKIIAQKDGEKLAKGPISCSCGNITLSYFIVGGRVRCEWQSQEPSLGNINLH